ncbi:hypothetical protein GLOIN_2v1785571 [Rhizophagus clarus]|uniref:Uncharacterized protein n=1 Tax=Rhizophagus clarus TaxID=94130 RepID=A0A8H3QL20_9GLOM|nr:hypothetical protein GLOIN_2v1785571 [Rhizophagus clarus]
MYSESSSFIKLYHSKFHTSSILFGIRKKTGLGEIVIDDMFLWKVKIALTDIYKLGDNWRVAVTFTSSSSTPAAINAASSVLLTFCLFHGHRQSGKTTAAWELKYWIENNSKYTVCYLSFNGGITTNKEDYSSGISPFSAEGVFKSTRFTSLVVTELLAQYVEENNGNIDFEDMLRMFTLLHWVSSAPAYIILRIKPCLKLTKQISVTGRSMFQLSYFNMVLRYGNKQVLMNEHDVKFLLAEGMVVEILHNEDGTSLIGCAAPILHTIMLSNIRGPDLTLSSLPTTVDRIDPKWLLARTVENLIFKQLISKAYSCLGYRVLPEVKERDEGGQRRQRLDILVLSAIRKYGALNGLSTKTLNSLLQQVRRCLVITLNVPIIILASMDAMKCIQSISAVAKSWLITLENKNTKM